jgi:ribosomal protein L37AE/L43A|tara:strand:- start:659 stop:799 length:141 start_codon:yes stop_codon:yes gene_type:complete
MDEFEEADFVCPNCHKKVKMLKRKGVSIDGLLCQKCGLGDEKPDQD